VLKTTIMHKLLKGTLIHTEFRSGGSSLSTVYNFCCLILSEVFEPITLSVYTADG